MDEQSRDNASNPVEVVVHAEQARIRLESHAVKRVHLRKRIVTEQVTHHAELRREELIVSEEAIIPARRVEQPPGTGEFEIILHEERLEVHVVVVPVERIRVRVHTTTDNQTITDVLRREQIDVETSGESAQTSE